MNDQDGSTEWVTKSQWGHHAPSGLWYLAVLGVPLLLVGAFLVLARDGLEEDLEKRTLTALESSGIKGAKVEFEGRDGTVQLPRRLPRGMDHGDVKSVVSSVDGVRVAELEGGLSTPDTSMKTEPPTGKEPDCNRLQRSVGVILGKNKVSFEAGSATVKGDEKRQLAEVAELLVACDASVRVIGHADPGAQRTTVLAQKRAETVAEVLAAVGVTIDAAEGAGSGQDLTDYADIVVS